MQNLNHNLGQVKKQNTIINYKNKKLLYTAKNIRINFNHTKINQMTKSNKIKSVLLGGSK